MSNTHSSDEMFNLIRSFGYTTRNQTDEIVDAILSRWGTPQPVVREPLTDEQRMEVFNEATKRLDENLNLPWRVAILEQVEIAHGITQRGGQHDGS